MAKPQGFTDGMFPRTWKKQVATLKSRKTEYEAALRKKTHDQREIASDADRLVRFLTCPLLVLLNRWRSTRRASAITKR